MNQNNTLVSICIPTYEMGGNGTRYLKQSLDILSKQTFKNFEVIVSDNSINDDIQSLCQSYLGILEIKHVFNKGPKEMAVNLNNAIKHANGQYIKILFQDDFLYEDFSLDVLLTHFVSYNLQWMATASCHYEEATKNFYKPIYPFYHDSIQYGHNTISSPSVIMMKNDDIIFFDENLFWLIDVDWYKQMYDKFGLPGICNYVSIVNREHSNRVSNTTATQSVRDLEFQYILDKYK